MREQRRLAAIVSVDVAGYSRMMGRDESGTLSAIKARFRDVVDPLVRRYEGRVVKTTGDGMLLEFPSVVDAARCAIDVQEGMARSNAGVAGDRRVEVRIGINIGDVIVDGDDLFGEGVNVAVRLEQSTTPGSVCLSDRAYQDIRGRVDAAFVDGGPRELKNIADAVRVWTWTGAGPAPSGRPEPPERASIAVLPFNVLSDDRRVGFLADGLVEDVTALLARMPGFFVVCRSSSFSFRDREVNAPQIARTLGVRYVVEGSVREIGDAMRVSTQLIDATTGRILWSGRSDVRRSETLDLQDDIARSVIAEIEPELTRAEIAVIRRQRPENVDAWGFYRQAVGAVALHGWREEAVVEARGYLERAFGVDGAFGLARANYALITLLGATTGLVGDIDDARRIALAEAEAAMALDDGSSEVLGYAGCAISGLGLHERGVEILERAVEIDPSNAQAHVALGAAMASMGRLEAGIDRLRHGIRLSPRDQRLAFWRWALGGFLLRAGHYPDALAEARGAIRTDPRLHLARILEAIVLSVQGEDEAARAALAACRRLRPRLTLAEIAVSHGRYGARQIARLGMIA